MFFNENPDRTFTVRYSHQLESTQLYHLKVIETLSDQSYSFYFRYNTLSSIHEKARSNKNYPQKIEFPSKLSKSDRLNSFKRFFDTFNSIVSSSPHSKITVFLELMGMKSDYPIDFAIINMELIQNNLNFIRQNEEQKSELNSNQDESISSESPLIDLPLENEKDQLTLVLKNNCFIFHQKKRIGGGGYDTTFLYVLDGIDDAEHSFLVKFYDFSHMHELSMRGAMMNYILADFNFANLDHENIVKRYFSGNLRQNSVFYSFDEFCKGGTLYNFLMERKKTKKYLTEEEIISIFTDILKGMQYIYYYFIQKGKKRFMHRNLKPDTIYFDTKNGRRIVKIGDFGLAKTYLENTNPRVF